MASMHAHRDCWVPSYNCCVSMDASQTGPHDPDPRDESEAPRNTSLPPRASRHGTWITFCMPHIHIMYDPRSVATVLAELRRGGWRGLRRHLEHNAPNALVHSSKLPLVRPVSSSRPMLRLIYTAIPAHTVTPVPSSGTGSLAGAHQSSAIH